MQPLEGIFRGQKLDAWKAYHYKAASSHDELQIYTLLKLYQISLVHDQKGKTKLDA